MGISYRQKEKIGIEGGEKKAQCKSQGLSEGSRTRNENISQIAVVSEVAVLSVCVAAPLKENARVDAPQDGHISKAS